MRRGVGATTDQAAAAQNTDRMQLTRDSDPASSESASASSSAGVLATRTRKAFGRKPATHADENSDTPILPKKPPNEGVHPEEVVEGRGVAKGNTDKIPAPRTQSRTSRASMGLEGVRQVHASRP